MDQNIIHTKPTWFGDLYYILKSNCSDKCNISIDCNTLLNVMQRDVQGDNGKNTDSTYPKNKTVTHDASANMSNRINKGADSYFELVLKSLKGHIFSLENQLV